MGHYPPRAPQLDLHPWLPPPRRQPGRPSFGPARPELVRPARPLVPARRERGDPVPTAAEIRSVAVSRARRAGPRADVSKSTCSLVLGLGRCRRPRRSRRRAYLGAYGSSSAPVLSFRASLTDLVPTNTAQHLGGPAYRPTRPVVHRLVIAILIECQRLQAGGVMSILGTAGAVPRRRTSEPGWTWGGGR